MNFNHIMIDLETLSNKSHPVIFEIGAIPFDPYTGEVGDPFHSLIDIGTWKDDGLNGDLEVDTLGFWLDENSERISEIINHRADHPSAKEVLDSLHDFIIEVGINSDSDSIMKVWSKPSLYDLVRLENHWDSIGVKAPWNFRSARCARTLIALDMDAEKELKSLDKYEKHHALSDCRFQIEVLNKIVIKYNLQVD